MQFKDNRLRQQRRRYRLHRHIKKFARMNARKRTVYLTDSILDQVNIRQQQWLSELRDKHKYNLQMEIE